MRRLTPHLCIAAVFLNLAYIGWLISASISTGNMGFAKAALFATAAATFFLIVSMIARKSSNAICVIAFGPFSYSAAGAVSLMTFGPIARSRAGSMVKWRYIRK